MSKNKNKIKASLDIEVTNAEEVDAETVEALTTAPVVESAPEAAPEAAPQAEAPKANEADAAREALLKKRAGN